MVALKQEVEEAATREVESALARRRADRANLRGGLSPAEADVIDQIEEIDIHGSTELGKQLVETARLAPEVFTPVVIEYAFGLLDANERWFSEAGLRLLATLRADPDRLCKYAMASLASGTAIRTAACVLLANLTSADESMVASVVPAAIELASPVREMLGHERRPRTAMLIRLNTTFPTQIATAFAKLFDGGPPEIDLAARGLEVLAAKDSTLVVRFSRDMISTVVRANWIPDPHDHAHDPAAVVAQNLEDAVAAAFLSAPGAVDSLLQDFVAGASEAGEARIFSIYGRVLSKVRFHNERELASADRLAFKRVLWAATSTTRDKVLREIESIIGWHPHDLIRLASENIDGLLGAAILMHDRIVSFDQTGSPETATFLVRLERNSQRRAFEHLRDCFISWAAEGAAASGNADAYLKVLNGLPEDRDEVSSRMIKFLHHFMNTATGLNAVLPSLYSALVGVSVLRRGSAVAAVGKMHWRQRENVPELLFEAFATALTDPYVYVHASAVTALRNVSLPPIFEKRVRLGLWNLICVHGRNVERQDLVSECIELMASRYLTSEERSGEPGAFMVSLLAKLPVWRLSNSIRHLSHDLANATGMVDLLVTILLDRETSEHLEGDVLDSISDLPAEVIYANREILASTPPGQDWRSRWRAMDLIQTLTRSGAWAEAEQLAQAAAAAIPNTVREQPARLIFELAHAATALEHALAIHDQKLAANLVGRWRELIAAKEANDRERAQRPDPLRNLRRSPQSL
jgi:hypothetical protein